MRQNRRQPDAEQVCAWGGGAGIREKLESVWPKGDLEVWSTHLWWVPPKTLRELTLSTNTVAGGFLKETRKDAEFSMWVGREEKQRQLIQKVLRDK